MKPNKHTLSTLIHITWPSVVEAIRHTGLCDHVEFVGENDLFDLHDVDLGRHFSVGTDITILYQWWKSQEKDLRKALAAPSRRSRHVE